MSRSLWGAAAVLAVSALLVQGRAIAGHGSHGGGHGTPCAGHGSHGGAGHGSHHASCPSHHSHATGTWWPTSWSRHQTAYASYATGLRTLTTQFSYAARVDEVPAGTQVLNLWLPLPSDSEWQTVRDVTVDGPASHRITRERKYGNRMVYLRIERPTAPLAATVHFTVTRTEVRVLGTPEASEVATPTKHDREALRLDLAPDKNVPIGGKFGDIAKEVAGARTTPLDKIHALFDHVVATMQYDYKKESPHLGEGDVAFVCDYKKGNCSDLHSYVISLARSLGIPAVLEYGFPITGIPVADPLPKEGTIGGYHCWTWFKDPTYGWVPLDASDARRWLDAKRPEVASSLFGNLVLERSAVAFSRGRDLTLNPAQKAGPLNDFIYPYAEADGKPIKAKWEVKYRLP